MSLFTKFVQSVQSWRRRRGVVTNRNRVKVDLEQLDHRQLLAVNFTGNVAVDFPASKSPGVVSIVDNGTLVPPVQHPLIPNNDGLANIIKVSGLDISGISVTYDSTDDTLNVGLQQPLNQKPDVNGVQYPVISGDTDNNLDNSTVDPAVLALRPSFIDSPTISGTETMGALIDLSGTKNPNQYIIAGIPNEPGLAQTYTVAHAVTDPANPDTGASFQGLQLPNNEGNVYLVNDPRHGGFEFSIKGFSQLYLDTTGHALTPQSVIRIGAFGNSGTDDGISEAFFPPQPFTLSQSTTPPPIIPPVIPCPPVSPPILINPHSSRHVNTAHETNVRVTVLGSSGFDPRLISPTSVRLGGAAPYTYFSRDVNNDGIPDETFVFRGIDINLPPGLTLATLTGTTVNGVQFSSSELIFNKNDSFYPVNEINARNAKLGITTTLPTARNSLNQAFLNSSLNLAQVQAQNNVAAIIAGQTGQLPTTTSATPVTAANLIAPTPQVAPATTVKITPRQAAVARATARKSSVPTMTSASSFRAKRAAHVGTVTPAAAAAQVSQAQALAAQDAAIDQMGSMNSVPQTAG